MNALSIADFYRKIKKDRLVQRSRSTVYCSSMESRAAAIRSVVLISVAAIFFVGSIVAYYLYGVYLQTSMINRLDRIQIRIEEMAELNTDQDSGSSASDLTTVLRSQLTDDPLIVLRVWELQSIDSQITQLHQSTDSRYRMVEQQISSDLANSIGQLKTEMQLAESIPYSEKDVLKSFLVQVESPSAEDQERTLVETTRLQQQAERHRDRFEEMLSEDVGQCNRQLQQTLATGVNFTIPQREQFETEVTNRGTALVQMNTQQLVQEKESCLASIATVEGLIEQAKKDLVLTNVTAGLSETEQLLSFFRERSGNESQIALLEQYRTKATKMMQETANTGTSEQLEQIYQVEMEPILVDARGIRQQVVEQERLAQIEEQKRIAASAGIPVPPIEAPKVILIDVPSQRLYAYEDGISIFDVPVPITTGKAGFDTVRGSFSIQTKINGFRLRSPFPGIYYDSYVDFWMPFFQGYGIHDASWRSVYGTMDYPVVGSHGCVNVPFNYVSQLFYWAEIGTPVIVQ